MSEKRLAFPRAELRGRTARGGAFNALFLGGVQALLLVQGVIVTALLGPVAIGLYAIVSTIALTFLELKKAGVDEAFVQQSEPDQPAEFRKAFTVELGFALACSLGIVLTAPLIALAFDDGRLLPLTLAVAYLPAAFAFHAPMWVFFRRMDFVRLRLLEAIVPGVSFLVTVPLAIAGVGVWSLVIGPLVGNTVAIVVAMVVSPYKVGLDFDRSAMRRYLRFTWPIFASAGALLIVQGGQLLAFNIDGGIAAAGFVTLAFTFTRYADRANQIMTATVYPAACAVRERIPTLEELFEKSNRLMLMWALPFCALFVLFSEDLVDFVLGSDWVPAIVLLQGLAVAAAFQQLGYNWFSFYRARGDSRPQAVESAVMVAGFLVFAVPALFIWGFWGFVAGRVAGTCAQLAVRRGYMRRLLPHVRLIWLGLRSLAPVLVGAGAALALRFALWGGPRGVGQAAAELALFGAGTALSTWLAERELLAELRDYIRRGALAAAPARDDADSIEPAGVESPI